MSVLLDTHIWIWWLTGSAQLPKSQAAALDRLAASSIPCLAAISIWEAQMLVSLKRVQPVEHFESWIRKMTAPDTVRVLALDADVVCAVHDLPETFHGDPADRLIVATARTHGLAIATHDNKIRRSRLAPVWKP